jgi:glycosyltransferase involved in cell wall biosynthesis
MERCIMDSTVSFYCTVLNEEDSIRKLLDSIFAQTYHPSEVVIVDGGSTDRTVEIAKEYSEREISVRIIEAKGSNVAQGRNVGIAACKNDIIASSDADCRIDKNWLSNLMLKFNDGVDVVSGVYFPDSKTIFEECVANVTFPNVDNLSAENYLPSHRSVAFRKRVWEQLKFPENYYRSEDTWFDIEAKKNGFKFAISKDAKVYYRPQKNLRGVYKTFYNYTKSDVENNVNLDYVTENYRETLTETLINTITLGLWIFVLVAISWPAALLFSPLIFTKLFGWYLPSFIHDKSLKKMIYRNIIRYTMQAGIIFGYRAGQKSKNK